MNLKDKNSEGIIRPFKAKKDPQVGPDVIMVMIPSELRYLVQVAKAEEVPFNDMSLYHLYRAKKDEGSLLALSGPFFGAPHAVFAMEKLIVLGAKRIWVLGWCGALQHDLRVGTVVIPWGAVSEEGTSSHYPIFHHRLESDPTLNRMLEHALKQRGLPFSSGDVWTTDALYRETPEKVAAHQETGILAVEMEISALMTLAIYRSVAMAALLVVSDELFDLKWRPGFSNPLLRKNSHAAGEILLDLAASYTHTPRSD